MSTNNEDKLILGGHEFTSRFILGSGKFSLDLVKACIEKADAQIITLALRRANEGGLANILDYIPKNVTLLPNTSGARNAEEAVRQDVSFIPFFIQIFSHLCSQVLVCPSCRKHFFHVHDIRNFRYTGKENSLRITFYFFFTFLQGSYCGGTGPGRIITFAFFLADRAHAFLNCNIFCVQYTVFKNRVL